MKKRIILNYWIARKIMDQLSEKDSIISLNSVKIWNSLGLFYVRFCDPYNLIFNVVNEQLFTLAVLKHELEFENYEEK